MSPLSTYLRTRRSNRPTFRLTRHTNHLKNTAFRDFSNIWRGCIFFLLTFALLHLLSADLTTLLCFSTVHIVGSFYLNFLRLCTNDKRGYLNRTVIHFAGWTRAKHQQYHSHPVNLAPNHLVPKLTYTITNKIETTHSPNTNKVLLNFNHLDLLSDTQPTSHNHNSQHLRSKASINSWAMAWSWGCNWARNWPLKWKFTVAHLPNT